MRRYLLMGLFQFLVGMILVLATLRFADYVLDVPDHKPKVTKHYKKHRCGPGPVLHLLFPRHC